LAAFFFAAFFIAAILPASSVFLDLLLPTAQEQPLVLPQFSQR
jgi:hypothetical protein